MATINARMKKSARMYTKYREKRLALQKKVNDLERSEKGYKATLMALFVKAKSEGIKVDGHLYAPKERDEPIISKPELLYRHIKKTGNFDLLRRQVNPAAVKERWADGKKVPGVQKFPVVSLSVTKV